MTLTIVQELLSVEILVQFHRDVLRNSLLLGRALHNVQLKLLENIINSNTLIHESIFFAKWGRVLLI